MSVDPNLATLAQAGGAGLTLLAFKEPLNRLLGPTADYLGEGLKNLTKVACENTERVVRKAIEKLGSRIDEPGGVAPKVLKGILEEAPFANDELAAEYFGGVLASARTSVLRDDRAAAMIKLVSRLSTYQLRMHHVAYMAFRTLGLQNLIGYPVGTAMEDEICKRVLGQLKIDVKLPEFERALDLSAAEKGYSLFDHVFHGLLKEGLIGRGSVPLSGHPIDDRNMKISIPGIELFLWSYGKGSLLNERMISRSESFPEIAGIQYLQDIGSTGYWIPGHRDTSNV